MAASPSASRRLSGGTACVTGASSGIGRAVARALGAEGVHVFVSGRSAEKLEATAEAVREAGGKATAVPGDVRELEHVRGLVEHAHRETGRLDVMVNNAGLSHPGAIADQEPEEWREMLEVNVLALLVGAQEAIRAMRACGAEGHVVNVSSVAARNDAAGVYGATKSAVNAISSTLRKELEGDPIRVVNVMPGAVATNFARHFDPAFVQGFAKQVGIDLELGEDGTVPEAALQELQQKARQLLAHPDDVARAVLYAVTQPIEVDVYELVVRPQRQIQL